MVRRLYPDEFDKEVPNPWNGVTIQTRTKLKKSAVDRDQVYAFAWAALISASLNPPQQRSSVSSGYSGSRTYWQATLAGPTIEAKNFRTHFGSNITKPARWCGTRWRKLSIKFGPCSTPTLRPYWRSYLVAAFR